MSYPLNTGRYLENEVVMRSPEWLVPLLYEHLLKSLRRAVVQIEEKDSAGSAASLDRASQIVTELLCSLDRRNGGQLAENLASLYAYFTLQIIDADRGDSVGSLPQLVALVEELHGAWVEAAEKVAPRGGNATMATAAA